MTTDPTTVYLAIGAGLFALGAIGFLTRRHMILMVLSAELMLHGVALTLVTFGKMHGTNEGQAFTIFLLTVAACDAGLALSLFLALYQSAKSLDVDLWTGLREPDIKPPSRDVLSPLGSQPPQEFPQLTPAGIPPVIDEDAFSSHDLLNRDSHSNGIKPSSIEKNISESSGSAGMRVDSHA